MALQRNTKYPGRYAAPTSGQPQGGFKNRTTPASLDGSYLEKDWLDDWSGFFSRLLKKTGLTANGLVDNADVSQYFNAAEAAFGQARGNGFVNGDFLITQRGLSFVGIGTQYTADQWEYNVNPDGGVDSNTDVTVTPFALGQTDVPGNPQYFLNMDGSIAGGSGSENIILANRVEDVRNFSGGKATLSFSVKGSVAANAGIFMIQHFGTGGLPSSDVNALPSQALAITTSWERHTITFDVNSISTKTIGTNDDSFIQFGLIKQAGATINAVWGGSGSIAYAGDIDIADVQIEAGEVASDYDRVSRGRAFSDCERYFQAVVIGGNSPRLFRGGLAGILTSDHMTHGVDMRAAPTAVNVTGVVVGFGPLDGGAATAGIALTASSNGETWALGATGTATNGAYYGSNWGGTSEIYQFSAEF